MPQPAKGIAKRAELELREETGYRAGRLEKLLDFYSHPGYITHKVHLFVAHDLEWNPLEMEAVEEILVQTFTLGEALAATRIDYRCDPEAALALWLYAGHTHASHSICWRESPKEYYIFTVTQDRQGSRRRVDSLRLPLAWIAAAVPARSDRGSSRFLALAASSSCSDCTSYCHSFAAHRRRHLFGASYAGARAYPTTGSADRQPARAGCRHPGHKDERSIRATQLCRNAYLNCTCWLQQRCCLDGHLSTDPVGPGRSVGGSYTFSPDTS